MRSQTTEAVHYALSGQNILTCHFSHPLKSHIQVHTLLQRHTLQHSRWHIYVYTRRQAYMLLAIWNLGPMHQSIYQVPGHCVHMIKLNGWASVQWCRTVVDTHWSHTINHSWSLKFNDKGIIYNVLLTLSGCQQEIRHIIVCVHVHTDVIHVHVHVGTEVSETASVQKEIKRYSVYTCKMCTLFSKFHKVLCF